MRKLTIPGLLLAAALLALGGSAAATTVNLSGFSSDATPASQLDATVDFMITGATELTITLTNPAAGDALFNINELYWNGADHVTGLSLDSATHSVNGDVTGLWNPVETGLMADGFGPFDFAVRDGVGEGSPGVAMPGQSVVFVFTISGTGPFDMDDFVVAKGSHDDFPGQQFTVAAKFVNGPDDPEDPGNEDSAFGAAGGFPPVPEPSGAVLVGLGLLGLAGLRRR